MMKLGVFWQKILQYYVEKQNIYRKKQNYFSIKSDLFMNLCAKEK